MTPHNLSSFLPIIFVALLAILLLSHQVHGAPIQDSRPEGLIEVTGTGKLSIKADEVNIELGVINTNDTARLAQAQTAEATDRVVDVLESFNVTHLRTSSFSLRPVYNYSDSTSTIVGFESSTTISYTIDPESAGQSIDKAIGAGANMVNSVTAGASDQLYNQTYIQVIDKAVQDAIFKADIVAKGLNTCLEFPQNAELVQGNPVVTFQPIAYAQASRTIDAGTSLATSTVLPSDIDVVAVVNVSFQHKNCTATNTTSSSHTMSPTSTTTNNVTVS